jgi:transcriptional regulator of acetoin/glycerol metabolism
LNALINIILQIEHADDVKIRPEVMDIFIQHPWPGNIRQLHNVLRTALALADGTPISELHLTQDFIDEIESAGQTETRPEALPLNNQNLDDVTTNAIVKAMKQHSGNVSAVARQLNISRNTLYRKLKALGLH